MRLIILLNHWLIDWVAIWVISLLTDRLSNSLIDWSSDCLFDRFIVRNQQWLVTVQHLAVSTPLLRLPVWPHSLPTHTWNWSLVTSEILTMMRCHIVMFPLFVWVLLQCSVFSPGSNKDGMMTSRNQKAHYRLVNYSVVNLKSVKTVSGDDDDVTVPRGPSGN